MPPCAAPLSPEAGRRQKEGPLRLNLLRLLLAAEALVLFLDKKNQKSSHLPMLLGRTGPLRCKAEQHHGCLYFALNISPLKSFIRQNLKGPCLCAQGHHVLPHFHPKLGGDKKKRTVPNHCEKEAWGIDGTRPGAGLVGKGRDCHQ
jgi:hypothetical protein